MSCSSFDNFFSLFQHIPQTVAPVVVWVWNTIDIAADRKPRTSRQILFFFVIFNKTPWQSRQHGLSLGAAIALTEHICMAQFDWMTWKVKARWFESFQTRLNLPRGRWEKRIWHLASEDGKMHSSTFQSYIHNYNMYWYYMNIWYKL